MDGVLGTALISNAGLRFPPSLPQFPLPEESRCLRKGRLPPINVSQKLRPSLYSTETASFISPPSARARGPGSSSLLPGSLISPCFGRARRIVSSPRDASLAITHPIPLGAAFPSLTAASEAGFRLAPRSPIPPHGKGSPALGAGRSSLHGAFPSASLELQSSRRAPASSARGSIPGPCFSPKPRGSWQAPCQHQRSSAALLGAIFPPRRARQRFP